MKWLLILTFMLAGCATQPNFETGEGCWRYGVLETGNTGPMTRAPLDDIPVIRLSHKKLNEICEVNLAEWLNEAYLKTVEIYGCFVPRPVDGKPGTDTIYLSWRGGKMAFYEERCHVLLGRKHNACYGVYGIGKDESACEWVAWSAENKANQKRMDKLFRGR